MTTPNYDYFYLCPELRRKLTPDYRMGCKRVLISDDYYPALDRIAGRPYATLVCAGSDGTSAARQVARIATGWRLKAVAQPLIVCTRAQTPEAILAPKTIGGEDLARCEEAGAALAAGLLMGVF